MALNMDAIGKTIGPMRRDYTWKNAVLYALGVGAGSSELHYCFEKNLKVIPSFSIAMIFDFLSQAAISSGVNLAGILHGEQELIFHNPIPAEGSLTTTGKIVDYYDKGKDKGALIVAESDTVHTSGKRLFSSIVTIFGRLDGGFGGKDRKKSPIEFPNREPDFVVDASPSPDQPLLYRLSGDIFHLHVDPEFAKLSGFKMPIMHGLCTHGFACRALITALVREQPEQVRRFSCRFTKPLYPGVPIKTLIWKTGDGKAVWRTINGQNDQVVIDNGEFEYGDVPNDEIRFDDRVAIVTGASTGLGRTLALAQQGAKVVVNDLGGTRDGVGNGDRSPADRVVEEIKEMGGVAVARVFEKMPDAFAKDAAIGIDVVFQFRISGLGGGNWSVAIKDGNCKVTPGKTDDATCTLEIADSDFLRLIAGDLIAMQAYMSGKLKIQGDVMKAPLFEQLFKLS